MLPILLEAAFKVMMATATAAGAIWCTWANEYSFAVSHVISPVAYIALLVVVFIEVFTLPMSFVLWKVTDVKFVIIVITSALLAISLIFFPHTLIFKAIVSFPVSANEGTKSISLVLSVDLAFVCVAVGVVNLYHFLLTDVRLFLTKLAWVV